MPAIHASLLLLHYFQWTLFYFHALAKPSRYITTSHISPTSPPFTPARASPQSDRYVANVAKGDTTATVKAVAGDDAP